MIIIEQIPANCSSTPTHAYIRVAGQKYLTKLLTNWRLLPPAQKTQHRRRCLTPPEGAESRRRGAANGWARWQAGCRLVEQEDLIAKLSG